MPLGAEHVEPAELDDLVVLGLDRPSAAFSSALGPGRLVLLGRLDRRRGRAGASSAAAMNSGLPPSMMSVPRPAMLVATVTAPLRPGLGDDLRLPLVLLGVQHLVRDAALARACAERFSDFSTLMVPTSTGWPFSCRSAMSSTTASNLASSVL